MVPKCSAFSFIHLSPRDEHALLRSNLERLLEITFPSPRGAWKEARL